MDFDIRLKKNADKIHKTMEKIILSFSNNAEKPHIVNEATNYIIQSGGKRIRPYLFLEITRLLGVSETEDVYKIACAIEYLHCYSLVHDDLPGMDNSDLRRGQPTVHKKYSEATAILCGDAMLILAFEILSSETVNISSDIKIKMINQLAKSTGIDGMIKGQQLDLTADTKVQNIEDIILLQNLKTGKMISCCIQMALILAGKENKFLLSYGEKIGLAFQIKDDLLDVIGNEDEVGKTLRQDTQASKSTFVSLLGVDEATNMLNKLITDAKDDLKEFGKDADNLVDLANYIIHRNK